jgi:hypothetical protein
VAYEQDLGIGKENFNQLLKRIEGMNREGEVTIYSKAVLKFVLQIIAKAVESQPRFK